MQSMLFAFSDSLKLAKIILPELLELTTITEYRNTAYNMISRMKDSGIISENDYAAIHNRLVLETKIEYKRTMASLTKENTGSDRDFYRTMRYNIRYMVTEYPGGIYNRYGYNSNYSLLSDILDLSLPLRNKNQTIQEIARKVLKITDNEKRLSLMPVLLKYNIDFEDSVYMSLAKNKTTRIELYRILAKAKRLDKFPKQFMNHRDYVLAGLYANESDYNRIDTVQYMESRPVRIGKDSGIVYIYQYKFEEDDEWNLYVSDALPTDTNKLNGPEDRLLFYAQSISITPEYPADRIIEDLLFENQLIYTRFRNGGYYDTYSYSRRYRTSSFGY
jgi:hypothetical protein